MTEYSNGRTSLHSLLRPAVALCALWVLGIAMPAGGAMRVFACEPEWAALAEELGGDRIDAFSATTGRQDPHTIQARPSLIAKLRRAKLLICSGAELEIAWLPLLLRRASNAAVQPGNPGNIDVSLHVKMLDIPTEVDRAHGDVHPFGNPHTQLDPRNIRTIAVVVTERLKTLDPDASAHYQDRFEKFDARWQESIETWEREAAPLREMQLVTHHTSWVYLANWLGLKIVAHLEAKPGIPPTAAHLSTLLESMEKQNVRAIVRAAYQPERASRWLSERSDVPAFVLPHTIGSTEDSGDLFALYRTLLDRLLEVAQ